MDKSEFSQSHEYKSFRSSVPLRRIVTDSTGKSWKVYDSGPKSVRTPLVCLPPVSGTADVFFRQILALSARGIRVIAVEHPVYWSVSEWCEGFKRLMDLLRLDKVHLFGASLGGFLAQKFAELNVRTPRVASLILCNTFTDTSVFNYSDSAALFWMLPALVLKKMLMSNFTNSKVDAGIADSIDFMVEKLESLTQQDLASRLTLNCVNCYVQPDGIKYLPVTIIDVFDEYALSGPVREELYKCYPNARLAHLKSGGNFPYLSRSDQVNIYIQIHLRAFQRTDESPWLELNPGNMRAESQGRALVEEAELTPVAEPAPGAKLVSALSAEPTSVPTPAPESESKPASATESASEPELEPIMEPESTTEPAATAEPAAEPAWSPKEQEEESQS